MEFYRHFQVPGLEHCTGGKSGQPENLFSQLREWVESGVAPEETHVKITDLEGKEQERVLCPYPAKSKFNKECGEVADAQCWGCV